MIDEMENFPEGDVQVLGDSPAAVAYALTAAIARAEGKIDEVGRVCAPKDWLFRTFAESLAVAHGEAPSGQDGTPTAHGRRKV